MGKKVIIAEKPSVAKNIADAVKATRRDGFFEGADYIVSWAFGHLLELFDAKDYDPSMKTWRMEKFPYIPEAFQYKVKSANGKKGKPDLGVVRQIKLIGQLINRQDVDGIISATDDDREGQVIADELLMYLRPNKPVERILLNEWTPAEVLRGLGNLRPNKTMRPLHDAGFGRQRADWLIGINLTSVATLKFKSNKNVKLLNVGRVLMPTLKIIYDRDKEIENFKVTKYYRLKAAFESQDSKKFEGIYYVGKNEKFDDRKELDQIAGQIPGHKAEVLSKEVKKKKEYPPYLFNLTNLQGYVTGKYRGWTSDKVLKTAQSLYEKKLITYPRTASSVLDESIIGKTKKVLEIHADLSQYKNMIKFHTSKRVFDSKKVESHSAIIPTYIVPKNLNDNERIVYEAVRNRFLAQFMPAAVSLDTTLKCKIQDMDLPGIFQSKGKVILEPGWKLMEGIDSKEVILPDLEKGDLVETKKAMVEEVERKPPKHHTEKTLLRVMETCGKKYEEKDEEKMMMAILSGFSIGTPATRAETIKKLKTAKYIRSKGKSLICTDLGRQIVETFPVRELFDLEYTGRLEKTLQDIEKQKFTSQEFMEMIKNFVVTSVQKIKEDPDFGARIGADGETIHSGSIGKCPECGGDVYENERAFGCSNWKKGCKFTLWKNDKFIAYFGKEVTYEFAVNLLKYHGKVGLKDCMDQRGQKFNAIFYYEKDPETGRYQWRVRRV
ncbi:MAG: DNA topoisomerase [Lachnospiraceae bacterium]|nr:DNA topoisomerase [Lachnospiraceae bacterium]